MVSFGANCHGVVEINKNKTSRLFGVRCFFFLVCRVCVWVCVRASGWPEGKGKLVTGWILLRFLHAVVLMEISLLERTVNCTGAPRGMYTSRVRVETAPRAAISRWTVAPLFPAFFSFLFYSRSFVGQFRQFPAIFNRFMSIFSGAKVAPSLFGMQCVFHLCFGAPRVRVWLGIRH